MSSTAVREEKPFISFAGLSLLIHVIFFVLVFLRFHFSDRENIDYQSAIRVDMVDLPDKISATPAATPPPQEKIPPVEEKPKTPEPPKAEVKLPEKAEVKDAINLNKTKSKQSEALTKLKTMEALDKLNNEVQDEALKAIAEKPKYKGAALSAGTELTGVNRLQHENYIGDIDKHVKKFWALPQWLAQKNYRAQAVVKIDKSGKVLSAKILKSSGNNAYDEEVLQTIQNASPFPAPPEKFVNIVAYDGITLGFPE